MSFVQISSTAVEEKESCVLFRLGFRPFFLGAGIFSVFSILYWTLTYSFQMPVSTGAISLFEWHAHQMIYGFSMAVIAGFLLTAIMNWTSVQTLHGTQLALLVFCWAVPRITLLFGIKYIALAAVFEVLFVLGLTIGVAAPIVKVRQWGQVAILANVALLGAGNLCFYLDAFGLFNNGAFVGVYGGLFLVVGLILVIGGRVMPPFIRNGLSHAVNVSNPLWAAILSFIFLFVFAVNFLSYSNNTITGVTAGSLFTLTTYRLVCWHTPGIWSKPLLWGLFLPFVFIDLGFLLFTLHAFTSTSLFLGVHAFAYGGIGLATLAMMARVSIGHSGRSIGEPPVGTGSLLAVLTLGALIRIFLPLVTLEYYRFVIIASQILWIIAFTGFVLLFARMLVSPRVDGKPG